jgi:hypothetical protein
MSGRSSRTLYVGNLPGDIRLREVEDLFYKVRIPNTIVCTVLLLTSMLKDMHLRYHRLYVFYQVLLSTIYSHYFLSL